MRKVTVFGGGATGYVVSAELGLRGFDVCLCENPIYKDTLAAAASRKEITINGPGLDGDAKLFDVTTDLSRALDGTKHIIICTISNRDEEVAELLAPHIKPGQYILLSAGNLGSYIFRRVFDKKGVTGVIVGETCGNLFPSRIVGEARAITGLPWSPKLAAAWPTCDTICLIEAFSEIYQLKKAINILHCALDVGNMMSHIGPVLLNTGAIENVKDGCFYLFQQGITPSIIRLVDAMWEEKKVVMDALSYPCSPSLSSLLRPLMDPDYHGLDSFKRLSGPNSIKGRHISEDTPTLVCLMISVAEALDIDMPLFKALVKIASTVNDCDYYNDGRTLRNLGLGHLRGKALMEYFGSTLDNA